MQSLLNKQGSFASQMTTANVMDVISRLPGCGGQAADAISAYTQVKMEDAPSLLRIPKSECPDIWIRLPRHKWPKSLSRMEEPVVPLERNLCGLTHLHSSCGKDSSRKFCWSVDERKYRIGMYVRLSKTTIILIGTIPAEIITFSTCSQAFNGQEHLVTSCEPLAQVITLRGPLMVSRKLAMKEHRVQVCLIFFLLFFFFWVREWGFFHVLESFLMIFESF